MDGLTVDEFIEAKIQERVDFLDNNLFPLEKEHNEILKEFEKYTKLLLRARKTDSYGAVKRYTETARFKEIMGSTNENDKGKENELNGINSNSCIKVKKEKLSIPSLSVCEDTVNMPAPKMPAPKTKRVKKEKLSTVAQEKESPSSEIEASTESKRVTRSNIDRTSDVILQNPVIPMVDLVDSSEKEEEAPVRSTRTRTKKKAETASTTRSTRTRTKKTAEPKEDEEDTKPTSRQTRTKPRTKRDRSESESENVVVEGKRSKSESSADREEPTTNNISTHTEYEDAVSHLENRPNETFVISADKTPKLEQDRPRMNETVVLEKAKVQQDSVENANGMITDDESGDEQVVISPQKKSKQDNLKQVFSPYENSPVKKKVEAFEKFQKNEVSTSSNNKMNTSKILKEMEENRGNVKEKAKGFIGSGSTSFLRSNPPSASKIGKYIGQKTSLLNNSRLGTPSSGHDLKERELKRLEKEKEQRKREMSKQAMKKKHDEKLQQIQQQQKEAREKEMEKALHMQKLKDEKVKMILQLKEEKHRQQKEENERRRLLAKQRAEEKRKEEEALKLAMQEKKEQRKKIETENSKGSTVEHHPIYMTQPTPPLACADCYDSDDERYQANQKNLPSWASKSRVKLQDYLQTSAGHRIKNTLFCCQSQSIDLRDVFTKIDARKLKRTSSANWDRPPRFTLLPPLQQD